MAIEIADITLMEEYAGEADLSVYTGSATPAFSADTLYLIIIHGERASGSGDAVTPSSVTTVGLTWVQEKLSIYGVLGLSVYRCAPTSGASAVTEVDFGTGQLACTWQIIEIDKADITGTNGENAVINTASNSTALSNSLTVTLPLEVTLGNLVIAGFNCSNRRDWTAGTGLAKIPLLTATSIRSFAEYNLDDIEACAATMSGVPGEMNSIAVEVKVADEVAGTTETLMTLLIEEANPTAEVAATALVDGTRYEIKVAGTTDFTTVGAADSVVGTRFTANSSSPATGTGTTYQVDPVICESTNWVTGVSGYVLRGGVTVENATAIRSDGTLDTATPQYYVTYPNGDPVLADSDEVVFQYDGTGNIKSVTGGVPLAIGSLTGETCT